MSLTLPLHIVAYSPSILLYLSILSFFSLSSFPKPFFIFFSSLFLCLYLDMSLCWKLSLFLSLSHSLSVSHSLSLSACRILRLFSSLCFVSASLYLLFVFFFRLHLSLFEAGSFEAGSGNFCSCFFYIKLPNKTRPPPNVSFTKDFPD